MDDVSFLSRQSYIILVPFLPTFKYCCHFIQIFTGSYNILYFSIFHKYLFFIFFIYSISFYYFHKQLKFPLVLVLLNGGRKIFLIPLLLCNVTASIAFLKVYSFIAFFLFGQPKSSFLFLPCVVHFRLYFNTYVMKLQLFFYCLTRVQFSEFMKISYLLKQAYMQGMLSALI